MRYQNYQKQQLRNQGLSYEDGPMLQFYTFQHPWVCKFVEVLQEGGIEQLLTLTNQRWGTDLFPASKSEGQLSFDHIYHPTSIVAKPYPLYDVDVDIFSSGAYVQYNWELFFHIPLFIATRLMQDQRHEEAMRCFHYFFNPMTDDPMSAPQRYWNFKPFRDEGVPDRIQDLLLILQDPNPDTKKKAALEHAIKEWREHPFEPHRVARGRPGAYMKTVVMKYIDNLIAWGDKLFRQDTIESINEATQLYILAANLLGPRPQRVPTPAEVKAEKLTYKVLRPELDKFSNAAVLAENLIIHSPFTLGSGETAASNGSEGLYGLPNLAFCIPHNDTLLGYWDTVEDRLFKIRHCMNIEGVVRELPLFEPPIDPALLVRATAMGLDLSQVLDDLAAPLPHYRFTFMLQKAREFCEELKQLGGLVLSALEKRDAEKLSQIRATHEKDLLKAVLEVKKKQVNEAEETKGNLDKARLVTDERKSFYENIAKRIPEEIEYLHKLGEAQHWGEATHWAEVGVSLIAASAPDISAGATVNYLTWGGSHFASAAGAIARGLAAFGSNEAYAANVASIKGGWTRRQAEWDLQARLALKELDQIDKQIAAADIRREIAENELSNHEKQIEQATQIEEFLREKFTNQDLYNWMVSQVSAVFFQVYKLAYDMAKRAERAYRYELGISDSGFVQFGAWDSLHKGLLAGEKLSLDLRRLEKAYLENNRRTYEITKHVSLVLHDPLALITLKETGICEVNLPETLFDADYPGHYARYIKSVGLTIPCVIGPYTNINCTLSLLTSRIRVDPKPGAEYPEKLEGTEPDKRFDHRFGSIQQIATSRAQNDTGMFELNFRDERLLPFEGAGALSRWRIELPEKNNAFDFDTISDVVLTLNYTAREGGELLRKAASEALAAMREVGNLDPPLRRFFSARHEFANEWHRFLNPKEGATPKLEITIDQERFPFIFRGHTITLQEAKIFLVPHNPDTPTGWDVNLSIGGNPITLESFGPEWEQLSNLVSAKLKEFQPQELLPDWVIEGKASPKPDELDDLWILLAYTV